MKTIEFLIWLRDEVLCCPQTKEGSKLGKPSNGELKRWIKNSAVLCNGEILTTESAVEWPVEQLVLFPNNQKARCTLI